MNTESMLKYCCFKLTPSSISQSLCLGWSQYKQEKTENMMQKPKTRNEGKGLHFQNSKSRMVLAVMTPPTCGGRPW
eukprot:910042-Amphidinium_carterae.1